VLSFVVPAYNEEKCLAATLESIHTAARALALDYEIVVANDASTDSTLSIAEAGGARVVTVENRQIAGTRNAGARASRGERLLFVDADTRVDAAVVGAAMAAIDAGAVGGGAGAVFDEGAPYYARRMMWWVLGFMRLFRLAAGCFLFCRRDAFEAAGGWDERHFAGEEIMLSLALHPPAVANARNPHDQGDVEHLGVQGLAMLPAAVVEELLAMVRDEDDHGLVPEPALDEEIDQRAEGRIVGGDLGVVEILQTLPQLRGGGDLALAEELQDVHPGEARVLHAGGEALPEGGWGSVRGVRLHGMEIEEEGGVLRPYGVQPLGGAGVDVGRGAVPAPQQAEGLEPLIQSEVVGHVGIGDEPRGAVPPLPQPLGQGDGLGGEGVPMPVDAVSTG